MQTFTPSEKFVHRLVSTYLKQHIDILSILEKVLEKHHVGVLHGTMDFNLAHQLLLGPAFRKASLYYDLTGAKDIGLLVHKFIASGKASLTEELALGILPDESLSIVFYDFFLDDRWYVVVIWVVGIHIGYD